MMMIQVKQDRNFLRVLTCHVTPRHVGPKIGQSLQGNSCISKFSYTSWSEPMPILVGTDACRSHSNVGLGKILVTNDEKDARAIKRNLKLLVRRIYSRSTVGIQGKHLFKL